MLSSRDRRCWPSRLALRYIAVALVLLSALLSLFLWRDTPYFWDAPTRVLHRPFGGRTHPIMKLMVDARLHHEALLANRTYSVPEAAARYRSRRERHPPPGFDVWFRAAMDAGAVVVEEYFDRIYKDLTPFWALDPNVLKQNASSSSFVVKVRGGKAEMKGDVKNLVPWLQLWTALVQEFAAHLPDLDMPINPMDESRLLVPFATVAQLVSTEAEQRQMPRFEDVTTEFKGLKHIDDARPELAPYEPPWFGPKNNYWDLAVQTCGPQTPAHGVAQMTTFAGPAQFPHDYRPSYAYKGFIRNWTAAMDPCLQPHVRQLHGTFIEPISLKTSQELIPLFGGSKLPMNNEILIPGAMYLSDMEFYSGGDSHGPSWTRKFTRLLWRGNGSGGRPKPDTWNRFQRHRLVDMLNGTTVAQVEEQGVRAPTFELPSDKLYPKRRIKNGQLGSWLKTVADAAFVNLCSPTEPCPFFDNVFHIEPSMPMKKQYQYKFLPDVDGNSFSARFRGFLRSTSLPLKATIYAEWHDDRLVPWLHFVPLDNTLQDLIPALDFFADGSGPGDAAASLIAERGQQWAETVLRREDMRLYVWRLLLEWARVCDENRHTLGFVEDLKEEGEKGR